MYKYIATVSGGKDSIAMFYLILSKKMPLDCVVFYNTGMEFESVYKNMEFIRMTCEKNNIDYIEINPKEPFIEKMHKVTRNGTIYGWCGGLCRWGTTEKQKELDKIKSEYRYIGIAYDEPERILKMSSDQIAPLYDNKICEKDALAYCRYVGFDWLENGIDLYDILDRVSCWCCRNKNQKELYRIWRYLPKYWDKLIKLQESLSPMKKFCNKKFGFFGDLRTMEIVFSDPFFDKYKIEKYE